MKTKGTINDILRLQLSQERTYRQMLEGRLLRIDVLCNQYKIPARMTVNDKPKLTARIQTQARVEMLVAKLNNKIKKFELASERKRK
jgi:hypothetical protein